MIDRIYWLGVVTYLSGIASMALYAFFNHLFLPNLPLEKVPSEFWIPTSVCAVGLLLMGAGLIGNSKRGEEDGAKSPGS